MIEHYPGFGYYIQAEPEGLAMGKTKKLPDFIQKQIDKREGKAEKGMACKKKKGSKPKK